MNNKTPSKNTPPLYRKAEERGAGGESKVALYIRVSTERQANEGDSLEEQENELRKFCDYRNYHIYSCYIERGKSGGNTNRPEYQKLIKDIEKQRISAIVVKKLDRLSRSLMDFEQLMKLMQEKEVEFISLKENFDTTTAMGKAMLRVALVFAQLEREQTSERIKDVFDYRAQQGLYNGGYRPFGYANVSKELVPYKKERKILEFLFDKFIETKSTTSTANFLNENGYLDQNNNPFDKRQIQGILQNPVYLGKICWKGTLYEGVHQPIISEKKFQEIQDIFKRGRYKQGKTKTQAVLQKLLFCGSCGSPMSPSFAFNVYKKKYYYYRCTKSTGKGVKKINCNIKQVPYKKVEQQVFDILLTLATETQFKMMENKILKYNQSIEKEALKIEKQIVQVETRLENFKEKKEKYLDTLIANQYLSKERELINAKIQELEKEEKTFNIQLNDQQYQLTQKKEEKINTIQFKQELITFRSEYENYSLKQIQDCLSKIINKITYQPDKLTIKFRLLTWKEEFPLQNTNCHSP